MFLLFERLLGRGLCFKVGENASNAGVCRSFVFFSVSSFACSAATLPACVSAFLAAMSLFAPVRAALYAAAVGVFQLHDRIAKDSVDRHKLQRFALLEVNGVRQVFVQRFAGGFNIGEEQWRKPQRRETGPEIGKQLIRRYLLLESDQLIWAATYCR